MKKTRYKKGTLMHSLLTDDSMWNFWKEDWSKLCRVKWNGKTPFKEVQKQALEFLGIKESEMVYERSLSTDKINLTID